MIQFDHIEIFRTQLFIFCKESTISVLHADNSADGEKRNAENVKGCFKQGGYFNHVVRKSAAGEVIVHPLLVWHLVLKHIRIKERESQIFIPMLATKPLLMSCLFS